MEVYSAAAAQVARAQAALTSQGIGQRTGTGIAHLQGCGLEPQPRAQQLLGPVEAARTHMVGRRTPCEFDKARMELRRTQMA